MGSLKNEEELEVIGEESKDAILYVNGVRKVLPDGLAHLTLLEYLRESAPDLVHENSVQKFRKGRRGLWGAEFVSESYYLMMKSNQDWIMGLMLELRFLYCNRIKSIWHENGLLGFSIRDERKRSSAAMTTTDVLMLYAHRSQKIGFGHFHVELQVRSRRQSFQLR